MVQIPPTIKYYASLAQLVEHPTFNRSVTGSSPVRGTNFEVHMKSTEEQFLNLLSKDIDEHPENLVPVSTEMWNSIKELTAGVEVDLDSPIEDDEDETGTMDH
ncbi:type II toxin-antitoxin system [Xanthomonas phage XbC2]|nr:type II toxin-antitoxin system [Xanthomonas phage XbC2]